MLLYVATVGLCKTGPVQAQFGMKCDSPAFAYTLNEAKFPEDIEAAIRATCAFNKKNAEMAQTFGKMGWSWDLLPKARSDVAELKDLANTAAELNFKTRDPRALGNIRNMYMRVGDQQRWLAEAEAQFARRQATLVTAPQSVGASPDPTQTSANATFLYVVFQDDISKADKDAFLQAYSASIVNGPDANQTYRLSLPAALSANELQQVLESMNSQTKVVKSVFAK
jgi:hypothetical protein